MPRLTLFAPSIPLESARIHRCVRGPALGLQILGALLGGRGPCQYASGSGLLGDGLFGLELQIDLVGRGERLADLNGLPDFHETFCDLAGNTEAEVTLDPGSDGADEAVLRGLGIIMGGRNQNRPRRLRLFSDGIVASGRRRGKLNSRIINETIGLNHVSRYVKHFGSLRKAYALIDYAPPRDCDWIETRDFWAAEQAMHAAELAELLRTQLGLQAGFFPDGIALQIGGDRLVSFLVARRLAHRGEDHAA